MHDLKAIVNDPDGYKKNLNKRGFDISLFDQILDLHQKKNKLIQIVENARAEVKKLSKEIGPLKKEGKDASELMNKVAEIKKNMEESDQELHKIKDEEIAIASTIPNLIADDVPQGKDEDDNKLIHEWGTRKEFSFKPKDHVDIGESLGMLDFETATKTTGSRFVFYRKDLARMERALINYMIDRHLEHGYEEVMAPYIVHERALYGTGQLPKFKEDLFKIEGHDWYLIPTAEVPLTNIKREELFNKSELPIKVCGFTPCFRSEAGSYGKDTRGLIRMHQFNKVEMVNIVAEEESEKAHEEMVGRAQSILEDFDLPYRMAILCTGDIGFGARRTIDLEVWIPSQNKYREISSVSNCWDFQSRRADIRYRGDDGKPRFAHTLNGSGLAVGRTLVAILENYQQEDGSVVIPEKLRPYMGGKELIKA